LTKTSVSWIPAKTKKQHIKQHVKNKGADLGEQLPSMILGAGHSTHKNVLLMAHKYGAISVLLMKPSLPTSLFDFIICPQHDGLTESDRILNSRGTINKIEPGKKSIKQRSNYLVLLGGPSKHFSWNEKSLIREIVLLCKHYTDKQWLLSNSPRTPASFMEELIKQEIPNLNCHHFNDDAVDDLNTILQNSAQTWITPDSMSMLYESLTAGCATSVLSLSPTNIKKPSKVAHHIQKLISDKVIGNSQHLQTNKDLVNAPHTIWEADRAAQWLLTQYSLLHQLGKETPA